MAEELGIGDRAVFTGQVPHDEVQFYYELIDIFVISRPASRVAQLVTPLKPLEAMAMEKPLIVSDLPALRELVNDGETGLIYRAEDSSRLGRSVRPIDFRRSFASTAGKNRPQLGGQRAQLESHDHSATRRRMPWSSRALPLRNRPKNTPRPRRLDRRAGLSRLRTCVPIDALFSKSPLAFAHRLPNRHRRRGSMAGVRSRIFGRLSSITGQCAGGVANPIYGLAQAIKTNHLKIRLDY